MIHDVINEQLWIVELHIHNFMSRDTINPQRLEESIMNYKYKIQLEPGKDHLSSQATHFAGGTEDYNNLAAVTTPYGTG